MQEKTLYTIYHFFPENK